MSARPAHIASIAAVKLVLTTASTGTPSATLSIRPSCCPLNRTISVSREGTKTIVSFVCPVVADGCSATVVSATASAARTTRIFWNRFTLVPLPESASPWESATLFWIRGRPSSGSGRDPGALSARGERHEGARRGTGVVRARADQAVVVLLEGMRAPAADAGGGEDRGAQVDRDAERVVDDGGEEIHVHRQVADAGHRLVHAHRGVEHLRGPGLRGQLAGHLAQHAGPRVVHLVDGVPPPGHS